MKRKGKIWVRIFTDLPITSKPVGVRMGKGKGVVSYWAARIHGGTVIFEATGVKYNTIFSAFKTGGAKLPIKTKIYT